MGHIWDPARYTLGAVESADANHSLTLNRPYACVVLNQPLDNIELAHSIYERGM